MIFFPLKWLPWILVVCGFLGFVLGGEPFSLVSMLIGIVWLVLKYKGKNGGTSTSSTTQKPIYNNSVNNTAGQTTTIASNATGLDNSNVCPNCNTPLGDGMCFCTKCGTKVR